ncbi:MAG: PKD domain-containing protein, partial [Candidatus Heimdallarchaeota archaeon]
MLSKSEKKSNILAILSVYLILSAFLISCRDVWAEPEISNFTISPNPADVGESIQFDWSVIGYDQILINFGDGNSLDVTGEENVSHIYSLEGRYDVILTAIDHTGDSVNQVINLVIENEAPIFDFTFDVENNIAYEDEAVNISVVNLVESDVDKAPGVLNYIFNFADGIDNQVSTNQSSVLHSWSNAGTYPMTVSVIDDQGALNQKIKDIKIINKPPSADIEVSVEDDFGEAKPGYIATFNWQNDMMNSIPIGWEVNDIKEGVSVSIVDSGIGDHDKVLRLKDDSHQNGISMTNSFDDQAFGTVEFWVKTSNPSSKTWTVSLWGDSDMALQVLIDDMNWKYTTSTSYQNIFPSSNIEVNTWYHVRVDFCIENSSGNYNNLSSMQFKIFINDLESSVLSITNPDLTNINSIKLESGFKDTGTSWINAIGYSWDPFYQLGDNRWPKITYSDKALFLMKAVDIKETRNDVDSLRYFWQFGDGTSSFGKYVYHQYGAPGLYKVILMLKDDNGEINFSRQYVSVNYLNPTLDINSTEDPVVVYEGKTIGFNTNVNDDATDLTDLQYFWNFEFDNPVFDPNNLDDFEIGGWRKSHIYRDDYSGNIYSVVRDLNNYTTYSSVGVNVLNVDPTVSIWDASIITDCSVLISRSSEEIEAEFTIALLGNNDPILIENLDFSKSDNNFVYFEEDHLSLSLSKYWQVLINSSIEIPDYSWFKYDLIFHFQNGEILVISSNKLYGDSACYWEVALNPYFYDDINYNFKYPVTFNTHVWDPSIDDIDLTVSYDANFLVNLS